MLFRSGLLVLLQKEDSNSPQAASVGRGMRQRMQSTQPVLGTQRSPRPPQRQYLPLVLPWPGGGAKAAAKNRAAETHPGAGCLFSHSVWNESPFIPASEVSSAGPLVQSECLQRLRPPFITRRLMEYSSSRNCAPGHYSRSAGVFETEQQVL